MVANAVAVLAFAWSWIALPRTLDPRIYYELVFWGGGHVLQFAYTLLMLVNWIWLASAIGARLPLSPRVVALLMAIALLSVFLTPITYLAYEVTSVEHHRLQTLLMRFGGGLVIPPIALAVLWSLWPARPLEAAKRPLRASLIASLVLFSAGGIIGFLISGNNVKIPAHYHGCIVGVTLASGPEVSGAVSARPVALAVVAALCFGLALFCLDRGARVSTLMTLWGMRVTSVSILVVVALVKGSAGGVRAREVPGLWLIGIGDLIANALFGLASSQGQVSVAAVLGSLYPVVTAVLAWIVVHERMRAVQYLGSVLAVIGAAVIATG